MSQTVFDSELSEFCTKTFIKKEGTPDPLLEQVKVEWATQEQRLFERLMLFERLCFKVQGDSIIVPVLLRMIGERGLDDLIDHSALSFVLWNQNPGYFVKNIPGVDGIVSMKFSNPEHSDPEGSIEAGLNRMTNPLLGRKRKRLVRKLLPLYSLPHPTLTDRSIEAAKNAIRSGELTHYGLPKVEGTIDTLSDEQRVLLTKTISELAEYSYLLGHNMTSFNEYRYFSPFWRSADHFQTMNKTVEGFSALSKLENVPDLKVIFQQVHKPLERLPTIRKSRSARQFREWLTTTAGEAPDVSLTKAYLDAIAARKGFFETAEGKVLRSIGMASIGAGLGAAIGGVGGAMLGGSVAGAVAEKVMEVAGDAALNVFDSLLLEQLMKGWSPRMFMDELSKLQPVYYSDPNRPSQ